MYHVMIEDVYHVHVLGPFVSEADALEDSEVSRYVDDEWYDNVTLVKFVKKL